MNGNTKNIHATAVKIGEYGVLLTGASGSGKSDLALRLIDRGAMLISDDQVILDSESGPPILRQAPNIQGKLEVRGIGIIDFDSAENANLRLIVKLGNIPERLPSSFARSDFFGYSIPHICLSGFETSAPIKVEIALKSIVDQEIMPVALQPL